MTITFKAKHKSGFTVNVLEAFTFPAGEAHIKGFDTLNVDDYEYFFADVRGHNPQDLFHLSMWADGLDALGDQATAYPKKYLILPYIPGARADRGVPFGAEVYTNFFNMQFFDQIFILDPHSPVAPAKFVSSTFAVDTTATEFPFERIIRREIQDATSDERPQPYAGVIAPDKGAIDRATRAARAMGVPVYTAGKTRDFETGHLTGFHMEDALPAEGKFLLVDDICDGGGTFVGLAEAIKESNPKVELDLWVTHGVFSKGVHVLLPHFGEVHTTNSYYAGSSWSITGVGTFVVHDITPYMYAEVSREAGKTK